MSMCGLNVRMPNEGCALPPASHLSRRGPKVNNNNDNNNKPFKVVSRRSKFILDRLAPLQYLWAGVGESGELQRKRRLALFILDASTYPEMNKNNGGSVV